MKMKHIAVMSLAVSIAIIAACSSKPAGAPATAPAGDAQAAASHETPPPAAPASGGPVETVQGQVLEAMDSGGYTYVRVKTAQGDIWAATLAFKVAVGDTVVVPLENPMRKFNSPTMKRDFDLVYFASRITKPGEATASSAAALPPGHPPMTPAAPATAESMVPAEPNAKLIERIAPPQGGSTIAGVWTDRKALAGKMVTIRGKVIKYNPAIMGLNWLHIQDGSGAVKDGTHDLTVTSSNEARVGDIVTITGTVVVDKNFGAGYGYAVMLQGAKIAK